MPVAKVGTGLNLYYEVQGRGIPWCSAHEFAGDYRSWEPQVRFFSRLYQVITYNDRGYPPSGVPKDPEAYSQEIMVDDLYQLLASSRDVKSSHLQGCPWEGIWLSILV